MKYSRVLEGEFELTRQVPLVEQELPTLPEHMGSPAAFSGARVIRSLVFLLAIVLSVLLRFTDSDYPFGIFWPLCCLFFFNLWILITSLWYLQTLLDILREKSK